MRARFVVHHEVLSWSEYFPFEVGLTLQMEARVLLVSIRATLEVVENSEETLTLGFRSGEQRLFTRTIPETFGLVTLVYRQEGCGNSGTLSVDGQPRDPMEIDIQSDPENRSRRLAIRRGKEGREVSLTLQRVGSNEVRVHHISSMPAYLAGLNIRITAVPTGTEL